MRRQFMIMAGITGLLAVLAGTFGAHGLKGRLEPAMLEVYHTGVHYHVFHALAILGVAALAGEGVNRLLRAAGWAFFIGIVLFSGALYALALSGQKWLGMVAPAGGTSFMIGWALLAAAGWKMRGGDNSR